uniref:Homeodomain-like protein n=1 Tax=Tanacetum cinerariifolium TaxID=118510 RepID=A0A6L2MYP2_TANCI|nr:homeodomain-like protein [Tanacetum cinerariifolium]
MTRSSTKELFTPFKYPEQEFRSSRKHSKTLSLDESRSPDFDLFSDQEEYSEKEVAKTMAETLEQYMSKTRADYGSGIARPKIEDNDNFEKILDSKGAIPSKTVDDAKVAIQEMAEYSQKWHNGTSRTRKKRHEENSNLIKEIRASTDAAIKNQGASIKTLEIQIGKMNKDIKVPLILERPFLSTAHAKIDVFKRNITLRVREGKIFFKSVKPASNLIKRVYMLSLREIIELDFEARLMGETLVLNRSLDLFFEDYIELNDLNVPLELRRDQVDDLMPTIKEGEVVKEFRARNDARTLDIIVTATTIRRSDKMEYKGNNVVGALMNIPIFVITFTILTDFVVLEDMDAYRNEGIGDVIFDEPFFREVGINAKWFEGMITIHNGNEEVTYQMAQLHPRFKHHSNKQCNKIPPLLKVSEEDKMNGILYSYQKLKSFYKGVLNLGPEYVRDAEMEEWVTRGHISMHGMK